jgi:hypothetical protein
MKRFLFLALALCLSAFTASAQTTAGRLSGTISGPDGVLPGATVSAVDNNTAKEITTTSDSDGHFVIPQLEFGAYTVTVKATGFKTYIANEVKIDVGREYSLSPTLEVGNISENVTVVAGADIVTSTTPQITNTVSPQQILSLPLITRNPLTLILLQAGTTSNAFQGTTINGMRTTLTNITRDGINIQDTFIRTNATDFAPGRPSVDDTGEFTITTANGEADQGYGGAQVRLVTPRGSKDFHGGLFAYNRNSKFAANNFFNNRSGIARPFRNRNQFGGKINGPMPLPHFGEGGPVLIKDKAFFFFAYEGIRDPLSTRSTRTILTPTAQAGTFRFTRATAGAATTFCPSTTAGSTCTIPNVLAYAQSLGFAGIPATIDPTVQSRVLSQLPTASNAAGGDGLNTAGFALNRRSDQTRNQWSTRLDFDVDENNSIAFFYAWNNELNLRPDVDTTKFTVVPAVSQSSKNRQLTLAYRHNFGAAIVNEVRGGSFKSDVPFDRTDEIPGFFLGQLPVTNPENTFLSQGRNTYGYNLQDNVDWVKGNHSFKFGGQLQYFGVDAYNDAGIVPTYNITTSSRTPQFATNSAGFVPAGGTSTLSTASLTTLNNLLALYSGFVSAGSQSFNAADQTSGFLPVRQLQPFRYSNHSLYFQDRWQIKPRLSLTLGVRYELFPAMTLDNGLALEPVINDSSNPLTDVLNVAGTYNFVGGNAGHKNAYYKTDWNNFAPVVGFAYSLGSDEGGWKHFLFGNQGQSVIRGGYSHIYGNDSIVTSINNAAVGNAGLGRTTSNAVDGTTATLNDRLSVGLRPIAAPAAFVPPRTYLFNNSAAVAGNFGTVFAVDPGIQIPRIDQYSIGLQREFGGNTAVEIRYVGTRSNNLARSIDFNQIDIFNNGFLADFNRASANRALTGNPFCVSAGCQPLQIFQNGGTGSAGHLAVGTGVTLTTFNNNLINGTPTDLALLFIQNNLNNHPSVASPNATPFIKLLNNPGTGVANLFTNGGFYRYNSLQVEVRRRLSQGLYLQGNYTFSKNLTNTVGTTQQLVEPFLDINNKQWDIQRADFDVTHVFNFNGIYAFPFGKGRKFLNQGGVVDRVFGGWELSGILNWTSGPPITFVDTRGTLNRNGRSGRQTPNTGLSNDEIRNLVGHFEGAPGQYGVPATQQGAIFYINPAVINVATGRASEGFGQAGFSGQAFFNVNPGFTGNMARSVIDGPGVFNIDAAMLKNIPIKESMRIQLRIEAFNLLNNVNFQAASQFPSITSSTFGQITQTNGAARQIQFAARFEF